MGCRTRDRPSGELAGAGEGSLSLGKEEMSAGLFSHERGAQALVGVLGVPVWP